MRPLQTAVKPLESLIWRWIEIATVLLLCFGFHCLAADFCLAEDFVQPDPLDPEVAPASNEGLEAMKGIRIPKGWEIQLFAAEPDVANIVAFDVDHRGRLFVCESFRQDRGVTDNRGHDEQWGLADLAAQTVQDRIDYHKRLLGDAAITYAQHDDRIRRVEDSNGDGIADRSVVFANGFNRIEEGTGAGVLVRGNEIFYSCIPKLWKLIDEDDDGISDERIVLSDGYGVRVAFRGHDLHGLIMGPDGRLYFTIGDRGYHITTDDGRLLADPSSGAVFRCELDGSGLEVFATGLRNPQELAFNDVGDLFTVDNNSDSGDKARIVQVLEGGDSGWRMHYQYLPDRGPFNRERIWEPFHPEQPAYIVPPIANLTDGPSGLAHYPGTGFGEQWKDQFLICDFRGGPANSGIRSFQLKPQGASYEMAEDADPIWSVLATDVAFGPDGALYFSDWVNGWTGLGKGRVYRLTDPKYCDSEIVKEVQRLLASDWSARSSEELSEQLQHTDRRVRFEAQWELARRADGEAFVQIATSPDQPSIARLHAIWGVEQVARQHTESREVLLNSIRKLLEDSSEVIQAAAALVVGQCGDKKSVASLRNLLIQGSSRGKYQAAMSLGKLQDTESFDWVIGMLAANDNKDPAIRHAGVTYLSALGDADRVGGLSKHESAAVRRAAVVALRRMRSDQLTNFLEEENASVALEAARAIYDVPVPAGMQALAGLLDESINKDDERTRRILNANFRLGGLESVERIAKYAADPSGSVEMRIEALDMLDSWANPDPRDRVLHAYRPLKDRSADEAAKAMLPHVDTLMASSDRLREKAIGVAAALGIRKIVPRLIKRVANTESTPSVRAPSLRALARLDQEKAVELANQVKMVPATELLSAALQILASHDAKRALPRFIEATRSRNITVRQLAWDILAKHDSPEAIETISSGVRSYIDGTLSDDVQLNVLEAAQGKIDEKQRKLLDEHQQSLAESDPLAKWLLSLQGGDPKQGKEIFFQKTQLSCVRCHKVDRNGGDVGPVLTVIGKEKDRRYLLEAICLPDASIAKGFETAVIADDSGQVFTGIVKSENEDTVELIQSDGAQVRIPTDEIVARRKGNSSMPQDLTKFMTPREMRDLVAYLASLQVDPRKAKNSIE